MQPLQHCIGPTIRIGREILCLQYAGFFLSMILNTDIHYLRPIFLLNYRLKFRYKLGENISLFDFFFNFSLVIFGVWGSLRIRVIIQIYLLLISYYLLLKYVLFASLKVRGAQQLP